MMKHLIFLMSLLFLCSCGKKQVEKTILLTEMELDHIVMGWPIPPHKNETVGGTKLSVGGVQYENGLWTNSSYNIPIVLMGNGIRLTSKVGADDALEGSYASVMEFQVIADGDTLFKSGGMSVGDAAKAIDLPLSGLDTLRAAIQFSMPDDPRELFVLPVNPENDWIRLTSSTVWIDKVDVEQNETTIYAGGNGKVTVAIRKGDAWEEEAYEVSQAGSKTIFK